jgi:putative ABC transport system permease protein
MIYFKQAWTLLRQEKFFSSVYIIGTGLSITVVMVLAIAFYLKVANIYPETNRDRMLTVRRASEKTKDPAGKGLWSASLSDNVVETCFRSLPGAEAVTAVVGLDLKKHYIQPAGSRAQWPVTVKRVDADFWRVFSFRFVDGKPFTEADFRSGIRAAVVSESLARRMFGGVEAVGRELSLDFSTYRVCGVVKDASFVTGRTYAQVWTPYTVTGDYKGTHGPTGSLGPMEVYMLAPSAGETGKLRAEATDRIRRYNETLGEYLFDVYGQPDTQWQSSLRGQGESVDFNRLLLQYGLVFLALLLIPAVSLSGMTESRMERRLAEMGVRRAFGAPVGWLMTQIVVENFLFTVMGGALGLLLSYVIVFFGRNWIMSLGQTTGVLVPAGTDTLITPQMLINAPVFVMALGVCFVLNLLGALIPAWRAAHREIIHSIHAKK